MEHHRYMLADDDTLFCPICGRRVRLAPGGLFAFDILTPGDLTASHLWGATPRRDEPPPWLVGTLRDIERGVL